jgi:hypothetical protein
MGDHGGHKTIHCMADTFIIFFLGMIPLWMFTLGKLLLDKLGLGNVTIPFENIILSLVMVIVPISIGLIIKYKKPNVAKKIAKLIRPFMIIFLIFMFSFGMYVNAYMFQLFTPMVIVAGILLPFCGFMGGAAVSAICRQPWKRIKTIALETGIQNTGVAILLLLFSLPSPDAELAIVGSVAVSMFTPVCPLILVAFYEIRRRCCKKQPEKDDAGGEKAEIEEEEKAAEEPAEEPVGLAVFIGKFKNRLPCLKKPEKSLVVDETEMMKEGHQSEQPNGIATRVNVNGENEKNSGDEKSSEQSNGLAAMKEENDLDENTDETPPGGQENAMADDNHSDSGEVNLSFVNDINEETSF